MCKRGGEVSLQLSCVGRYSGGGGCLAGLPLPLWCRHPWMDARGVGGGGGGAKVTSKKSRFSGPTPSNAPSNDVAPLKSIKDIVQRDGSGPN